MAVPAGPTLAGGCQLEQGGTSGKRARIWGGVFERDHGLWAADECVWGEDGERHVINHPNID